MSTQLVTNIEDPTFITKLQQVVFSSTDASVNVAITVDNIEVLNENYTPDADGNVTLYDVGKLLAPYLIRSLVAPVLLTWTSEGVELSWPFTAVYTSAMIEETTDEFIAKHFFTHSTNKKTAIGRKEVLYFYVDDAQGITPRCTAYYSDGSHVSQNYPVTYTTVDTIVMLEVSPINFTLAGKTLISYTIEAAARSATFTVAPPQEYAPALIFRNSFGCEETIYCVGSQELEPKFDYTTANVAGAFQNIDIVETKAFKAYTGILTPAMSNWADDLFRSLSVYLFTLTGQGAIVRGREVTITEAKAIRSNVADFLPNFEFTYRYSQNNHNIFDKTVAGRIFDDTFDFSFE